MRILIDTREQRPLEFRTDEILTEVSVSTLSVGDYTASYSDGSLCPIYFERKSIPDLFATLTSGHRRFRDEMERAKEQNVQLVLAIEGTLRDVQLGHAHSEVDGNQILKTIMTMWLRHNLVPMFFKDRAEMAVGIKEFYLAFGRNYKAK